MIMTGMEEQLTRFRNVTQSFFELDRGQNRNIGKNLRFERSCVKITDAIVEEGHARRER